MARDDEPAGPKQEKGDQKLLADLREANEKLVLAGIRAQELADLAEAAQARAELAAEKLMESERELRATAEFRERLLGIVGHDLRNPLGAISMFAQCLLIDGVYDRERVIKLVPLLLKTLHRMDHMLKQLSEFTRARLGGGVPLELGRADLRPICQHAIEELALTSTTPILEEYSGDTTGLWDGERLMEVISNLVSNAIEHADPGTAVLVKVRGEDSDAIVEVINHGQPIPEELMPVLFAAFHRGKPGYKARAGHLGLGLFIVHEIVQSHGGTIAVSCQDGKNTFAVRLPRRPRAAAAAGP